MFAPVEPRDDVEAHIDEFPVGDLPEPQARLVAREHGRETAGYELDAAAIVLCAGKDRRPGRDPRARGFAARLGPWSARAATSPTPVGLEEPPDRPHGQGDRALADHRGRSARRVRAPGPALSAPVSSPPSTPTSGRRSSSTPTSASPATGARPSRRSSTPWRSGCHEAQRARLGARGAPRPSSASTGSARTGCASGASRRSTSPTFPSAGARLLSWPRPLRPGAAVGRSTSTSKTCSRPSTGWRSGSGTASADGSRRRSRRGGRPGPASGAARPRALGAARRRRGDRPGRTGQGALDSPEDALRARQASVEHTPTEFLMWRSSKSTWWSSPTAAGVRRYSTETVAAAYREMATFPPSWDSLRVPTLSSRPSTPSSRAPPSSSSTAGRSGTSSRSRSCRADIVLPGRLRGDRGGDRRLPGRLLEDASAEGAGGQLDRERGRLVAAVEDRADLDDLEGAQEP